ncbi:hypothetical protein SEA_NERGAL_84 [Mycobacterium Phage Nergal]|nr:hypothetical protein SEA_NERGAL_84 [Mycobacterium Phage Nergal]
MSTTRRGKAKSPGAAAIAFIEANTEFRLTGEQRRFVRSLYNNRPDEAKRAQLRALFGMPGSNATRQQTSSAGGGG